jgi:hypothetical protein
MTIRAGGTGMAGGGGIMNRSCDHFFARLRFAEQKHRANHRRDHQHRIDDSRKSQKRRPEQACLTDLYGSMAGNAKTGCAFAASRLCVAC